MYDAPFSIYQGARIAGGNPACGEIGGIRFFGLLMGQNQHALLAFDTLLKALEQEGTPAARVIELGTSHGGLSVCFQLYGLIRGARFVTYDRPGVEPAYADLFARLGVDYRQGDVLEDASVRTEIGRELAGSGTSLLLCDNGDKRREFNTYAAYLKPGDLILAHDYAPDRRCFEQSLRDRVWSYCEIEAADVAEACRRYRLAPYLEALFQRAAWLCMRRRLHKLEHHGTG